MFRSASHDVLCRRLHVKPALPLAAGGRDIFKRRVSEKAQEMAPGLRRNGATQAHGSNRAASLRLAT